MQIINLYSDTQTLPSSEMRAFMAAAPVGDEQQRADPTVNALCEKVSALLGKEAAMFLPSGAMCNHIAIKTHTKPGDELIMDITAHVRNFESNSYAVVSGVGIQAINGDRGVFTSEDVKNAVREKDNHMGVSSLLIIEQTTNLGAGRIWPLDRIREVTQEARKHGLSCHMDGARLLNASVKTGISASDFSQHFDSVWIDFSKGLGAPVGAALAGSRDFIEKAWRYIHMLGGAMRQAGIIAAGALYALDHNVERLALDHANADLLGLLISDVPGIDVWPIETNMVYFDVSSLGISNRLFADKLLEKGLKTSVTGRREVRMVTHLDITEEMIRTAADIIRQTAETL